MTPGDGGEGRHGSWHWVEHGANLGAIIDVFRGQHRRDKRSAAAAVETMRTAHRASMAGGMAPV